MDSKWFKTVDEVSKRLFVVGGSKVLGKVAYYCLFYCSFVLD